MADIVVTPASVRPLPGAKIRDFQAGGSGNVGDLVYVAADGDVEQADGSAAGTANALGVVVSAGTLGATSFVAGDMLSVVYDGPVIGFASMTPGNRHYVSDTAGALGTVAGTTSKVMGIALTAAIFLIQHNM